MPEHKLLTIGSKQQAVFTQWARCCTVEQKGIGSGRAARDIRQIVTTFYRTASARAWSVGEFTKHETTVGAAKAE